jgi:hypothetical protein
MPSSSSRESNDANQESIQLVWSPEMACYLALRKKVAAGIPGDYHTSKKRDLSLHPTK